jgi:isopropylmalate/homocitrate/citramalate synthase
MASTPWRTENYWTSPYNHIAEVTDSLSLPPKVILHDATLRDGEQTPGVVLRKEEKVEIAVMLDRFGVERIEAGMPAVAKDDAEAIREISKRGLKAKIFAFARATVGDIELAKEVGAEGVIVEIPIGQPKLEFQFGWTWKNVLERSIKAVNRARELGLYTVYFPYDTTRSQPEDLENLLKGVMNECPPDSVGVVDTMGCALPQAISYLVRKVKSLTGLPVEIHTHNDLGLGVADALAAAAAGASVIHTCVNGIGERTGNAALEEVAMCLKVLYQLDVPYKFELLPELSGLVKACTGFPMAPNKPLVGSGNFVRESGIGADTVQKYPLAMFSLHPKFVGQKPQMVLGKKSGKLSVQQKLEDLGLGELEGEKVEAVLARVKQIGIERKGLVTDQEFTELVARARAGKLD